MIHSFSTSTSTFFLKKKKKMAVNETFEDIPKVLGHSSVAAAGQEMLGYLPENTNLRLCFGVSGKRG